MRYLSIGHYFWGMSPPNLRPVLSDLYDQFIRTKQYKPTDGSQGMRRRAVFVLASDNQYNYLINDVGRSSLWNKDLNWLNWGKTQYPCKIHDADDKYRPIYGIMLYRQLLPNPNFEKAITRFDKSDCIQKKIASTDKPFADSDIGKKRNAAYDKQNTKPPDIPLFCNPGDEKLCEQIGTNPCCLCTDMLTFADHYYPRCELVRLCDIKDATFWDKYLIPELPTVFDAPTPDRYPIPNIEASVEDKYDFVASPTPV